MRTKSKIAVFTMSLLHCAASFAADITLHVAGGGEVQIESTGELCSSTQTSCVLTVPDDQPLKIINNVSSEFYVDSWAGLCSSGSDAAWASQLDDLVATTHLIHKVDVADLNGDRLPDLAMQDMFYQRFVTALNLGSGDFSSSKIVHEDDTETTFYTSISAVDWDNDGDQDVLLVDYDKYDILLFINNGSGDFSLNKTLTVPTVNAMSIAVADINYDGEHDLLVASVDGVRMAWPNNLNDIRPAFHNGDISWFINDGNDNFSHYQKVGESTGVFGLDAADYDQDGDLDVVTSSLIDREFSLYTNTDGQYVYQQLSSGKSAYDVKFADVDNDNLLDVIGITRGGSVWVAAQLENHSFDSLKRIYEYSSGNPQALDVADMDGDGDNDIIVGDFSNDGYYSLLENYGPQSCVIDSSNLSSLEMTISFSKVVANSSSSTPVQTSPSNNSSGTAMQNSGSSGGAIGYLLLLAGLGLTLSNNKRQR